MLLKVTYLYMRALALSLIFLTSNSYATETTIDEELTPNPLTLKVDFFNFFETQDFTKLKARIQKTVEALRVLHDSLSEEMQNQTLMYFNKIQINLEALPKLKEEKEIPIKPRLFKESYTFEEIEILLTSESEAITRELNLEKEKKSLVSLIKKIEHHVDTQMAAYRKHDANTEKKLLLGLQIFTNMTSYAVMKEKVRVIQEKIDRNLHVADDFKKEEEFAFAHLNTVSSSYESLMNKLSDQEELLAMRELGSLHAELSAPTVLGDNEKDISEGYLLMQKSLRAQIGVAIINLDILELESKLEIIGNNSSLDADKILTWKRIASEIASQKDLWNSKAELELERIGHLGFNIDDPTTKNSSDPLAALAIARYREVQENLNLIATLGTKLIFSNALINYADEHLEKKQTPIALIADNTKRVFDDCCSTLGGWLHATLFKVSNVPITLMGLLEALMILCGSYFLSWFLRFSIARVLKEQTTVTHSNLFIFDRLLHYIIIAIGGVVALLSVGLELSSVFWVLGALSVGIGFGLQTIVNNFASSLILLFSRSIKVQDYIQLDSGDWGQVMDISVQNTILRTNDGIEIVIPNSQLISNKFMNWTMHDPYKRLHVPFSVTYGSDKNFVEEVVAESALKVSSTISNHPHLEGPRVWMKAFGDSALNFELVVWVNMYTAKGSHGSLQSSYLWEIESALVKHNISIPFPQCDITIKSGLENLPERVSKKNVTAPCDTAL